MKKDRQKKNIFLSKVNAQIRKSRPMIPVGFDFATREERVDNLPFVSLWFRTQGCSHDRQGACTFCNYGSSTPVSPESMIKFIKKGVETLDIDENTIFLMTPSGSMLDDQEVPFEVFQYILDLVQKSKCKSFLCETRAETITEEKIIAYAQKLEGKNATIEIGLESSNPWILKYCYNKILDLDDYISAIKLLAKHNIASSTTILLGGPFLSTIDAINDTVNTVKWAFEQGTERACIFPSHVKRWTLLEWLWKKGLYTPPSLWSLVEVLKRLGPELSSKVYIAWYKVYDEESDGILLDHEKDLEYLSSPTTCEKCISNVIELFDEYRDQHSYSTIEKLSSLTCECKTSWEKVLREPEQDAFKDRVVDMYEVAGRDLLGEEWWFKYGQSVKDGVA